MEKRIAHFLAIAPYEGMKTALERAAEAHDDINLDIRLGDLEDGAQIVRDCVQDDYDAVISRGGTAELIRSITELPVVEIELSMYDILRSIRLAQNYADRYAIVGFKNITESAHTLCDLLRYDIEIVTVHNTDEAESALRRLSRSGCRIVICDVVTHTIAQQMGVTPFLITSGAESVELALSRAKEQGQIFHHLRRENHFLRKLVEYEGSNTIVLRQDGSVYYSRPDNPSDELIAALRARIPEIPLHSQLRFYYHNHNLLTTVSAHTMTIDHVRYAVFHQQPTQIPMRSGKLGIRSLNKTECEYLFTNSFYSITGAMGELEQRLGSIAISRQPVMIFGEPGTGKEQIARAIYLHSSLHNNPLVVIDCTVMDEKSWDYLFSHHSSPLNSSGSTVYFQHLEDMPALRQKELLSAIHDTEMVRRERLLFTCDCREGAPVPEVGRRFASELGMLTLRLPTLRSRVDEIPSLASLYLNSLNYELGKQISGFEPTAVEQLRRYDWPQNYTQFKHVLHELATLETSSYIRSSATAELLAKERTLLRSTTTNAGIRIEGRTLSEINRDIAVKTVEMQVGNKTLAAKQLGISRTTLWRMLGAEAIVEKDAEK